MGPCGARALCRISPPRFLAESHKRRLNQGSFVSAVCLVVYFLWFILCLCVLFVIYIEYFPYCLFVSNSQVIGCEDRLRNDLYCVGWGVKLYSIQSNPGFYCFMLYFSGYHHQVVLTSHRQMPCCHRWLPTSLQLPNLLLTMLCQVWMSVVVMLCRLRTMLFERRIG